MKSKCPECKAELSFLLLREVSPQYWKAKIKIIDGKKVFDVDYSGDPEHDGDTEEDGYLCPECYGSLFQNAEEAKNFLLGVRK